MLGFAVIFLAAIFTFSGCPNPSGSEDYTTPTDTGKVLQSIAVKTAPTSKTYAQGAEADLSGMVITLTYDNGTTEDVAYGAANAADFTLNGYDKEAEGDQSVTITYGGVHRTRQGTCVNRLKDRAGKQDLRAGRGVGLERPGDHPYLYR